MADLDDFRICFKTRKSRDKAFCSVLPCVFNSSVIKRRFASFRLFFFCVQSLTFLQSLDERYIVSHYAKIW